MVSAVGNMALEHYNQQQNSASNNASNTKSSPTSKFNTILTLTQLLSSTLSENSPTTSSSSSSSPSFNSQSLSSSSSSSSAGVSNLNVPAGHSQANSGYSPLLSVIDYIQSLQSPKSRKSSDDDGLDQQLNERPQTPCQSSEEYISPTYARNYQGVWKYVVQIPDEGFVSLVLNLFTIFTCN